MSEIIQANCSWSKTSGETDLGRNAWTQESSPQDNSPHIKLTRGQLAPDSETTSPHVVILHNVLKYAGKIINILKLYSPQLDINLADTVVPRYNDHLYNGNLDFRRNFFGNRSFRSKIYHIIMEFALSDTDGDFRRRIAFLYKIFIH